MGKLDKNTVVHSYSGIPSAVKMHDEIGADCNHMQHGTQHLVE